MWDYQLCSCSRRFDTTMYILAYLFMYLLNRFLLPEYHYYNKCEYRREYHSDTWDVQYVTHTSWFYFTPDSITDHTTSHSILARYCWYSIIYISIHDYSWYSLYVLTYVSFTQIVVYLIYLTVYHGRVFYVLEIAFFLFLDR